VLCIYLNIRGGPKGVGPIAAIGPSIDATGGRRADVKRERRRRRLEREEEEEEEKEGGEEERTLKVRHKLEEEEDKSKAKENGERGRGKRPLEIPK